MTKLVQVYKVSQECVAVPMFKSYYEYDQMYYRGDHVADNMYVNGEDINNMEYTHHRLPIRHYAKSELVNHGNKDITITENTYFVFDPTLEKLFNIEVKRKSDELVATANYERDHHINDAKKVREANSRIYQELENIRDKCVTQRNDFDNATNSYVVNLVIALIAGVLFGAIVL